MKTEYQFIRFESLHSVTKTSRWACVNKSSGHSIGVVEWYGPWRQYCYFPEVDTVYSDGCMEDIQHFIRQLGMERKAAQALDLKSQPAKPIMVRTPLLDAWRKSHTEED